MRWKPVPVRELIAIYANRLGIKNAELASKLGYKSSGIISMLKAGTMTLGRDKIVPAATTLGIDPIYLFRCVDAEEGGPLAEIFNAANDVLSAGITQNELSLLRTLREHNFGMDFNMEAYPEQLTTMCQAFESAARAERAAFDRDAEADRNRARSALAHGDRRAESESKS